MQRSLAEFILRAVPEGLRMTSLERPAAQLRYLKIWLIAKLRIAHSQGFQDGRALRRHADSVQVDSLPDPRSPSNERRLES
jgi:hypothetical protein